MYTPSLKDSARARQPELPPDLRVMLAKQELQEAQAAMQRNQALMQPQQMPTVAEMLDQSVTGNARQDIMQKMGAMQSAQDTVDENRQSAPGAVPPAAAGGLKAAAQPLQAPKPPSAQQSYATGGIVAFAGGGPPPVAGGDINSEVARAMALPTEQQTAALAAIQKKYGMPAITAALAGKPQAGKGVMAAAPQLPPDVVAGNKEVWGALQKQMNVDPEAEATAASQRYEAGLGKATDAYTQAQIAEMQRQEAARAQHAKAVEPTIWDRLANFSPRGYFGEGVAAKNLAMNKAHQDLLLKNAMEQSSGLKAAELGMKGAEARYGVGEEARKGAQGRAAKGGEAAAVFQGHMSQTAASILKTHEDAMARVESAKLAAAARAQDAKQHGERMAADRETREEIARGNRVQKHGEQALRKFKIVFEEESRLTGDAKKADEKAKKAYDAYLKENPLYLKDLKDLGLPVPSYSSTTMSFANAEILDK